VKDGNLLTMVVEVYIEVLAGLNERGIYVFLDW
jgi:hypothetical protein